MATNDQVLDALRDVVSRLTNLETWANIAGQVTAATPGAVVGIEARVKNIEEVADNVVSALRPGLLTLRDDANGLLMRQDSMTAAIDQVVMPKIEATENRLNQMEALHQALVNQLNQMETLHQTLVNQLNAMPNVTGRGPQHPREQRPILEFKVVLQQSKLGNDRKEYKQWQEKMKNALDQVNPDIRITMEKIESEIWGKGEEAEWMLKDDQLRVLLMIEPDRWKEIKRDLYAVLTEKTEGDAWVLTKNRNRDGLMGYMRIHKWFTETSGRGLVDRKRAVMRPNEAKDHEMFTAIEAWEEELRELRTITGEEVMSEMLMKVALRDICTGKLKEWVDLKEDTLTYAE